MFIKLGARKIIPAYVCEMYSYANTLT